MLVPARSRFHLRGLAAALAVVATLATVEVRAAETRDTILLVGNSFTAGLKSRLRMLARSAGHDVAIGVCAADGFTLGLHAGSRSSLAKIHSRPWQTVVMQEQSDGIFLERYPGARDLAAEITGRKIFFMTWRDRAAPLEEYDDLHGVEGGETGYVPIAFELDAAIAPVGWAFREMQLTSPLVDLWSRDGHHANERGRYLAAMVLFATIYGESPVGLWFSPGLEPDQALHDQLLVESLVFDHLAEWNIQLP